MRIVARVFIFLIVLGFLLGPAIYLARDTLAPVALSWFARIGLGIGDLGDPRFRITALGRDELTIEAMTMADGHVTARSLRATYDLSDLSKGRLRTLAIRGLTIPARYENGVLSLGGIDMPAGSDTEPTDVALAPNRFPVDHVVLDDFRLVVVTDADTIELTGNVDARRGDGGALAWSGELGAGMWSPLLGGGEANLDLSLDGSLSAGGEIDTELDVKRGEARFRDLSLADARGGLRIRLPIGGPPSLRAALSFGDVAARGIAIPRLSVDVHGQGRSGTLSAVVGDPSSKTGTYTIVGDIRDDDGEHARIALSGAGAVGILHDLLGPALGSPLRRATGNLAFNGELGIRGGIDALFADPTKALARATGNGAADVEISSVEIADGSHDLAVRGGVTALVAPGYMEIRLKDGSRVRAPKSTSREIAKSVPRPIQPWFEDGVSVEFSLAREPLALLATLGGGAPQLTVSGGVRVSLGKAGEITLAGNETGMAAAQAGGSWNANFKELVLRASGLEVLGHRLGRGEASFAGSLGADGMAGKFSVMGDGTFGETIPLGGAALRFGGELTSAGHETRISLDLLGVTARPIGEERGGFALLNPVEISQVPGMPTSIVVSHANDNPLPSSIQTALEVGSVVAGSPGDAVSKALKLDIGRIDATLSNPVGGAGGRVAVGLDKVRGVYAGTPVRLSGLAANAEFEDGDVFGGLISLDAIVSEVAQVGSPTWIAPLAIEISGQRSQTVRALDLRGSIKGETSAVELPITGTIHLNDGAGRLAVDETWLTFGPEALSLTALSPALSERIEALTGRIGISGHFAWPSANVADAHRLALEVEDLSIKAAGASVENAAGGIVFSNFTPPRSEGVGTLSMDMLGLGVPIPNPRLAFSMDGLDNVRLHEASGGFAGGRISTRDVLFNLKGATVFTVEAKGVDAAAISSMLKVQGLDAEGSLSGAIPVTWMPGLGVSIADARLSADGPGTVRYKAGEKDEALRKSGKQVGLMLDALSDFRFKTLEMGLAGTPGAGFHIDLALEGSNPNLYDGYPVRFNLDLAGQLDDIIKTGYRTYTLLDRVRDAVLRGEAND